MTLFKERRQYLRELMIGYAVDSNKDRQFSKLRDHAFEFIVAIEEECPPSADRSSAIRKVREAFFTACASITIEGKDF
jgi:hypothetical protein